MSSLDGNGLFFIYYLLKYFYCFGLFKNSVISRVHNINRKRGWRNLGGEQRGISEPCMKATCYSTCFYTISKDLIPKGSNEVSSSIIASYNMIKRAVCQKWQDISEPCRIQVDILVRSSVNWDISIFHLSIPIDVKLSGKYRFPCMNARPVIESIKHKTLLCQDTRSNSLTTVRRL